MPKTSRLDVLLVERGLLPSRQAAQAAVIDGGVIVDGRKVTKPGAPVKPESIIEITSNWQKIKYVSRGGLKLEKALQQFGIDVTGRICLDLGASTGGFTDCLLQNGAHKVYAIDVGYGQLSWALRQDSRVVVKERTNVRHLQAEALYPEGEPQATLAVADLSFISITKVLPSCAALLQPPGELVALIKPQFEAGKALVGRGGVIRSPEVHLQVLQDTTEAASRAGFSLIDLTYSPVKGPAGNIEFLAYWTLAAHSPQVDLAIVVQKAHAELD